MSRDVLTVGSTMRILLLYRGEYSQWVKRFINYLEEQTDGEAMINSIKNGDQPLPRVTQVSIAGTTSTEQPPLKDKSMTGIDLPRSLPFNLRKLGLGFVSKQYPDHVYTLDKALYGLKQAPRQNCVSISTAESEYVAVSGCCAQVLWMRTQLTDYGFFYDKVPIYCDSKSAIAISCNPVQVQGLRFHTRLLKIQVAQNKVKIAFENADSSSRVELTPSKNKNSHCLAQVYEITVVAGITKTSNGRVRFHKTDTSHIPIVILISIKDGHDGVSGLTQLNPITRHMIRHQEGSWFLQGLLLCLLRPETFKNVVKIPKTKESFRLLYNTKGRFRMHSIRDEEPHPSLTNSRASHQSADASIRGWQGLPSGMYCGIESTIIIRGWQGLPSGAHHGPFNAISQPPLLHFNGVDKWGLSHNHHSAHRGD
nr:uncharacterized mitochondrial protein AtMg00810-like [Tanacetum cinerariifolium]